MKCHPVPSTSCDLCTYKVSSCYVQRFRRRYNYKKRDGRTDRQTDGQTHGRTDDGPTLVRNYYTLFFLRKSGYNKIHFYGPNTKMHGIFYTLCPSLEKNLVTVLTHFVIPLKGRAPSTTVSSILLNHFLVVTFVMNTL